MEERIEFPDLDWDFDFTREDKFGFTREDKFGFTHKDDFDIPRIPESPEMQKQFIIGVSLVVSVLVIGIITSLCYYYKCRRSFIIPVIGIVRTSPGTPQAQRLTEPYIESYPPDRPPPYSPPNPAPYTGGYPQQPINQWNQVNQQAPSPPQQC